MSDYAVFNKQTSDDFELVTSDDTTSAPSLNPAPAVVTPTTTSSTTTSDYAVFNKQTSDETKTNETKQDPQDTDAVNQTEDTTALALEYFKRLSTAQVAAFKKEIESKPRNIIPITLVILLDNSWSMLKYKEDTMTGVMNFIDTQQEIAKEGFNLYVYKFDTELHSRVYGGPIQNSPNLRGLYDPKGTGTALYQSMYQCMGRIKQLTETEEDHMVMFCIITDGEDNRGIYSNPKYTATDCFNLVKSAGYNKWQYYYMGAVHDAVAQGKKLGITDRECCIKFDQTDDDGKGTSEACHIMSQQVYRSVGSAYQAFGKSY